MIYHLPTSGPYLKLPSKSPPSQIKLIASKWPDILRFRGGLSEALLAEKLRPNEFSSSNLLFYDVLEGIPSDEFRRPNLAMGVDV